MDYTKLFDLTGKVVLTTGTSKGMGREMVQAFADQGATVIVSSRKIEPCQEVAEIINTKHGAGRAHAIACNIGHKEALEELVARTREVAGPIDVVCGNAGVNVAYGPMSSITDEQYDRIMQSNVRSNHWLAQMALPDMIEKGAGSMMFTSSIGAFRASPTLGTYSISKLALIGLIRNLALENGPKGVRVNAICPGLIRTDFAKALWEDPAAEKRVNEDTPLRRLGEPDDMAGVAVYLASDASKFMTGQCLTVCGGNSMWS
ncbi:MAG: SDR family oxidoreductase [Pseudomonadota bacterium]